MKTGLAGRWRADEGASLVEFSLTAFLLIILLMSVVEMARMVLVYTTVADAASAGMRYAIVHGSDQTSTPSGPGKPCTCTAIQTVVKDYAATGLRVSSANLTTTVTYPDGTNTPGSHVVVTVQYLYDPMIGYFSKLLDTTLGSSSEGVITY